MRGWLDDLRDHAAPGVMAGAGPAAGSITDLRLTRFRSHLRTELRCEAQMAVVFGPNGSGKTAILEALSMLAPGRGLRGRLDRDAMRQPDDVGWHVRARLAGGDRPRIFEAEIRRGGRRRVSLDGDPTSRARLAEEVRIIWTTPAQDRLWTDPAEARRRFLDRLTAAFCPDHARMAATYARAMRERNLLLREPAPDADWVSSVETRMAGPGAALADNRRQTLARLRASMAARRSVPGEGAGEGGLPDAGAFPSVGLAVLGAGAREAWERGGLPAAEPEDESWTPQELRAALRAGRDRDAAAGRALAGPHRADLAGWLQPDRLPLRLASTGEQKGALLGILLAAARALGEGARPALLLLDEIAAHLDPGRRRALFRELRALGAQVWMTGVEADAFAGLEGVADWYRLSKADGASRVDRLVAEGSPA